MRGFVRTLLPFLCLVCLAHAQRLEFTWPTPSKIWEEGRPDTDFLQQAGSGDPASGGYGCVRSAARQFHEGIDIKPVSRDRRGRPLDDIYAAMDGVVRHVNTVAGDSGYGRYIVIEHPGVTPAVYTLYGHLSKIAPGIKEGVQVKHGQVIATMGNTASYAIPLERAHLHFEIGVWVTRNFQSWYDSKKFGSRNEHSVWNGMNLMGFNDQDFLEQFRAKKVNNFEEYFARMKPAAKLRVIATGSPDFIQRYPSLLTKPLPMGIVTGWEISFDSTGIPFAWTPLTPMEVAAMGSNRTVIVATDEALIKQWRCKSIIVTNKGRQSIGKDLETVLQQLFGWR